MNRVLEELRIHHEEHEVPPEVLATIEEKKKKAVAKNVTVVAESKKRKGIGGPKVLAKKQRIPTAVAASATSISGSARASADAEEASAKNSGKGPSLAGMEAEKSAMLDSFDGGQGAEGVDRPKPSAANPMPGVLGGDSTSSDGAEDAGPGGALPSKDVEAGHASRRLLVDIEVLELSEDEVDSQPPAAFRSATFRPQTRRSTGAANTEAGMYQLHLSELPPPVGNFVF